MFLDMVVSVSKWIICKQKYDSVSLAVVFCIMAHQFGRLPLPCCSNNQLSPQEFSFKLLRLFSRIFQRLYSLSSIGRQQQSLQERYHARNLTRISYELLRKTLREFQLRHPIYNFKSVFQSVVIHLWGVIIVSWV